MSNHLNLQGALRYEAVHGGESSYDPPMQPRRGRPAALIVIAVGWLVLSGLGAGIAAMLVVGGLNRLGWLAWRDFEADLAMLALPLQQGLMVVGAVRRGRRARVGDLSAGLGWLPVRRRWLTAGLVGCVLLLDGAQVGLSAMSPGIRNFLERAAKEGVGLPCGSNACIVWFMAISLVGAPLAEELFFRGWLWVGLRRRWGAWGTGLTTGAMFLLLHGLGGEWRLLLMLVPVTVLLSLARELGGSVRASLVVHVVNNGVATAELVLGWAAG